MRQGNDHGCMLDGERLHWILPKQLFYHDLPDEPGATGYEHHLVTIEVTYAGHDRAVLHVP